MKFKIEGILSKDKAMKDDKKFKAAIQQLSSSSEHWLQVRAILLEEIQSNQELIALIDKKVKDNEVTKSKLN